MSEVHHIEAGAIEAAVLRAVDRVNELLADTQQLEKARGALLLETGTVLDSMAVINLLVFVEDEIRSTFGREITLAGADGTGRVCQESLRNLGALMDALQIILRETR